MNLSAITILISSTFLLSSCGGGGATASKVEYSDKIAAGTVADYTNADWIYQNYFGDYGLPEEVKPNFMPALKMLANGFVLQLKTGKDVKENIEQVHTLFLQYAASGEAAKFFSQVQLDIQSKKDQIISEAGVSSSADFREPTISADDKIAIEEAKQRDLAEESEIRKLAEEYQLPYKISEHKEQWFVYSPTMKGGGKGRGSNQSRNTTKPKSHQNITSWGWRPGDVIWTNGEGSITGVPGHVAIVWAFEGGINIVDANTGVGVSRTNDAQRWMDKYTEVRALTPRLNWSWSEYDCYDLYGAYCKPDSWIRSNAFWYSDRQTGKPYNWNFTNSRDTSKFYCTSLIWSAYNSYRYNIIAPRSLGAYGIITPSQFRDSSALTTFKVSNL